MKVGQPVAVSKLEALPWATNGRHGVGPIPLPSGMQERYAANAPATC